MALVKEYLELSRSYCEEYGEKTVLLMMVGSFYEVYGDASSSDIQGIHAFGEICDLRVVNKGGSIWMAGFKDLQLEKYVKKLQEANYTVVVYDQVMVQDTLKRELSGIFSPGTYFSSSTTSSTAAAPTNYITCIWVELFESSSIAKPTLIVGIATMDIFTGKLVMTQYEHVGYLRDSPVPFDELEGFLSVRPPRELVLLTQGIPAKDVIQYGGFPSGVKLHVYDALEGLTTPHQGSAQPMDERVAERIRKCEKQTYQFHMYETFFKDPAPRYDVLFRDVPMATQALCFLLDFVGRHNPHFIKALSEPTIEITGTHLRLPNHSLRQLHMIPQSTSASSSSVSSASSYSSVTSLLNKCVTPMGRRLLYHQLTHPVCDPVWLQKEYDRTAAHIRSTDVFVTNYTTLFVPWLSGIKDLAKGMRQCVLQRATLDTFIHMYQSLVSFQTFLNKSGGGGGGGGKEKDGGGKENDDVESLLYFFDRHIDPATATWKDPLLDTWREKESSLQRNLQQMKTTLETTFGVELTFDETHGWILGTNKRCEKIRGKEWIKTKQSGTHQRIQNAQIMEWNAELEECRESIQRISKELLVSLQHALVQRRDMMERVCEAIAEVDVDYTKTWVAIHYHYCCPLLREEESSSSSWVHATNMRHPLIEQLPSFQGTTYVSNEVRLGRGESKGGLIYGTNAVGKTSLIRSLGLCVLMAQSGFYVPCSRFEFHPYRRIITRILGNDDLHQGLSSFNVEVCEIRTIVTQSDATTLILGDELCKGTETLSALGIMTATLLHLVEVNASFLFATHMHELLSLEDIQELRRTGRLRVQHMAVTWEPKTGDLVYDRVLHEGPGSGMYGIEVCKKYRLPDSILSKAFEIRGKYVLLDSQPSRYNSQKIKPRMCEKCGVAPGEEMHHIQEQHNVIEHTANMIHTKEGHLVRKNQVGNLQWICSFCHSRIHAVSRSHDPSV